MRAFVKKAALAAAVVCIALAASAVAARSSPEPSDRRRRPRRAHRADALDAARGSIRSRHRARLATGRLRRHERERPQRDRPGALRGRLCAGQLRRLGRVVSHDVHGPDGRHLRAEFQSANFSAQVWVDGRALGSHQGSYLPFELRAALAAGRHTAGRARRLARPRGPVAHRLSPHLVQLGRARRRGQRARDRRERAVESDDPDGALARFGRVRSRPLPEHPRRRADRDRADQRAGPQRRRLRARDRSHGLARARRADDPAELPRTAPRPWPERDREHERGSARTGAVGAREPEPVPTDARRRTGVKLLRARRAAPDRLARRATCT